MEIVHFVARLKNAGPEPVIALITDSADDVSHIAERISERADEITTYPMWLIGNYLANSRINLLNGHNLVGHIKQRQVFSFNYRDGWARHIYTK